MASATTEERAEVLLDIAEDEAVLPVRRRQEDTEMDITPMIDITFLLLIFFIVASKLDSDASVALPTARNVGAINMQDAIVITVADGEPAKIYLGDTVDPAALVTGGSPLEQEEAIRQYVNDAIAADSSKKYIVIKASGSVRHRDFARVAKAAGAEAIEAIDNSTMYAAVMEKQ